MGEDRDDGAAGSADAAPQTAELDGGLVVRPLTGHPELAAACRLYRRVFGYAGPDDGLNPRMLQSMLAHGGSVVGGVEPDGTVAAFAFGWTAVETDPADAHVYHWSQAAVILPRLQGRGVGRVLKQVQGAVARRRGASRMRWTYDPLISRNAHFNLDVLGARGRWFTPDALGVPDTDRITVEWDLDRPAVRPERALPPLGVGQLHEDDDVAHLAVPTSRPGPEEGLATLLRARLAEVLGRGLVATSCRRVSPEVAVYRFERPGIGGEDRSAADGPAGDGPAGDGPAADAPAAHAPATHACATHARPEAERGPA